MIKLTNEVGELGFDELNNVSGGNIVNTIIEICTFVVGSSMNPGGMLGAARAAEQLVKIARSAKIH